MDSDGARLDRAGLRWSRERVGKPGNFPRAGHRGISRFLKTTAAGPQDWQFVHQMTDPPATTTGNSTDQSLMHERQNKFAGPENNLAGENAVAERIQN